MLTIEDNKNVIRDFIIPTLVIAMLSKPLICNHDEYDGFLTSIGVDSNFLVTIDKECSNADIKHLPKQYKDRFSRSP
ncbi:hypothetical protein [Flavobacterium sp. ASW18X]|uniref:hypothetical protein n=1 Tax=Flavobacterium sp. ASW18X TaxID=2572595 RepID=UPI0010ADFCC8|nr:hypothetical protein [Flavobacterium sp. ASW18X]TKD57933.1 hypothetical protein FBT53_15120 [Flavobacterium sp. ASW18X]